MKKVIAELNKAEREAQDEIVLQKAIKNKTLPKLDKKKCEKIMLDF